MRPSVSIARHRDQVREILARHRMGNPRIFGSAARGNDTDGSDLDILIEAPREQRSMTSQRWSLNSNPFSAARWRS
jgi:predicted nucleotidyltransferase